MRSHFKIILLFLFLGFTVLLHQFLDWGVWFQIKDLHHEAFALVCFAIAFGVYLGNILKK